MRSLRRVLPNRSWYVLKTCDHKGALYVTKALFNQKVETQRMCFYCNPPGGWFLVIDSTNYGDLAENTTF